jgi:amidase
MAGAAAAARAVLVELLEPVAGARRHGSTPPINAVVVRDCRSRAERAPRRPTPRRARGEHLGALHGLPMTVKESFDRGRAAHHLGPRALRGNVATHHATAVQRLLDAGAIVFGKTNVPGRAGRLADLQPGLWHDEQPLGCFAHAGRVVRAARAAALAAGLTPLELGSDIGASIRNPAHYCGVYGHKPTWGVVPMEGHQVPGEACIDSVDIARRRPAGTQRHRPERWPWTCVTRPLHTLRTPGLGACRMASATHRAAPPACGASWTDDPVAPVDTRRYRPGCRALADFLRQRGRGR